MTVRCERTLHPTGSDKLFMYGFQITSDLPK